MIKENIAQFYAVEIIVGRWKLLRAVGTGKPTSPPGYWPKKLRAYPVMDNFNCYIRCKIHEGIEKNHTNKITTEVMDDVYGNENITLFFRKIYQCSH